jgi:hypothetical protein
MIERNGDKILHNRWVLYFIVFVAFFNLISYALNGNLVTPLLFVLTSYITSFFSKNMIVILLMGLAISNLLTWGPKSIQLEGMTDNDDTDNKKKEPLEGIDLKDVDKPIDIPSETKRVEKIISDRKQNKGTTPTPNSIKEKKKDLDFIKDKYSELLKLQEKIMSNVGSLEDSLSKVDNIVVDVKKNMNDIKADA